MKKMDSSHGIRLSLLALFTLVMGFPTYSQTIGDVIPADSFLSLKLQNLAACREAIETSSDWDTASDFITASPKWPAVNQFLQMLPIFFGTDVQGVIESFLGDEIALSVSPGPAGLLIGIVIQNEGKTASAEQTLSHLITTLDGMGNKVRRASDTYRDIPYQTTHLNDQEITYGSLNSDIFLVGNTPECFKKMTDVYKKKRASITDSSPVYRSAVDRFGKSEVFGFVDVTRAENYLKALFPPAVSRELEAFQTLVYTWDLLQGGGGLRLYGELAPSRQDTVIPRLKADATLQTTRVLTGTEDCFISLSPTCASVLWQALLGSQHTVSELQSFLFPPAAEIQTALAGEQTLVIDISSLLLNFSGLYTADINTTQGTIDSVRVKLPQLNVGVVFKPDTSEKWQTFFNRSLEKFHAQVSKDEYKGIPFNVASIPGNLYYGNVTVSENDLFILAFSQKQFQATVDAVLDETSTIDLQARLARIESPPAGVFLIHLGALISALAPTNPWIPRETVFFMKTMEPLLASLVVQEESASLDITHAADEKGIDAIAKLAPFLFIAITEQTQFGE